STTCCSIRRSRSRPSARTRAGPCTSRTTAAGPSGPWIRCENAASSRAVAVPHPVLEPHLETVGEPYVGSIIRLAVGLRLFELQRPITNEEARRCRQLSLEPNHGIDDILRVTEGQNVGRIK